MFLKGKTLKKIHLVTRLEKRSDKGGEQEEEYLEIRCLFEVSFLTVELICDTDRYFVGCQ